MSIIAISGTILGSEKVASANNRSSTNKDVANDDATASFLKEAKKTPIDRIKERILKSHKLSQEQFDALDKETKAAIQREIQEAVKQSLKGPSNGTPATGQNANVLA